MLICEGRILLGSMVKDFSYVALIFLLGKTRFFPAV